MLKVLAYQYAESIDIKSFKVNFKEEINHSSADELFYIIEKEFYVYVFKYGVIGFLNYDAAKIDSFFKLIAPYAKNRCEEPLLEEFLIETAAEEIKFGYNKIEIVGADSETLRLILLNVSHSVALDFYAVQSDLLLEETNYLIQRLEKDGQLTASGKSMRRNIGKTLGLKNRITQNLYIFDSSPETWEDENLNKIDVGLKKTFDLQIRYKTINDGLQINKENLELFQDLMQYKKSNLLEWIIILLIFIEVMNVLIDKIIK